MGSYKDLKVWCKARVFIKDVYNITQSFPIGEVYGITSQIRRSSISIANNIVEGAARNSDKEFCRFLDIAFASAVETENLLYISNDLNLITDELFNSSQDTILELQRMILGLKQGIKNKSK